jgi:hypothetical protein
MSADFFHPNFILHMNKNETLSIHHERGQEYYNALADKLDALQSEKNDGRGVGHIRTLVTYLRKGMIREAKAVPFNESDKYTYLDDLKEVVKKELYEPGEKHPWSLFEK